MGASATRSLNDWMARICRLSEPYPKLALSLATLAVLTPFLFKPFNMDDPLFIWVARQIHTHPANPFGFEVNWYGTVMPMFEVTMNPPLASYYLALTAGILGWSEPALHAGFLLPAIAVVLGTHHLSRHFCERSGLAALITLLTPVFVVSSTTVMCDVMMLAFWVWAVVFWIEGLAGNSAFQLVVSGGLIAAAALAKYYGICLIPLLGVYGLLKQRKPGWWLASLVIPLLVFCLYHFAMHRLYGRAMLFDAATYAKLPASMSQLLQLKAASVLGALTFTGGCLATVTFFLPLIWRARLLFVGASAALLAVVAMISISGGLVNYGPIQGSSKSFIALQMIFWGVGGGGILTLTVASLRRQWTPESWLLFLWVSGTFCFAAFFNWTVNGRTILPMVPAVAILLARRWEERFPANEQWSRRASAFCLASGAALALLVAQADFAFAKAARESATVTYEKYGQGQGRFWLQGHWGFQYYMESLGASLLDVNRTVLRRGDIIATPENNTNFSSLGADLVVLRELLAVPGPRFLATMRGEVGGGFYAASRGPLPFAFGLVPPERIAVCTVDPVTSGTPSPPKQ